MKKCRKFIPQPQWQKKIKQEYNDFHDHLIPFQRSLFDTSLIFYYNSSSPLDRIQLCYFSCTIIDYYSIFTVGFRVRHTLKFELLKMLSDLTYWKFGIIDGKNKFYYCARKIADLDTSGLTANCQLPRVRIFDSNSIFWIYCLIDLNRRVNITVKGELLRS
jgi:hypothetical protein